MTAVVFRRVKPERRIGGVGFGLLGWGSAALVALATMLAVLGPWVTPRDPNKTDGVTLQFRDSPGHLLGYDANGRDVFSRLLAGARLSMLGPVVVVVAAMLFGVGLAVLASWKGGRVDSVISAGFDVTFAFPGVLLAILAAATFGASLVAAVIVLSIAYTPYIARVVRGSAMKERQMPYIAALEVQGMSGRRICLRHLLPNVSGVIAAQATTLFAYAMVDLAAISFLGLGTQPPTADWGVMVFENRQGLVKGHPWPSAAPGLCLIVVVIAFSLLGERLTERSEARA